MKEGSSGSRFLDTIRAPIGDTQSLPDDGRLPHRYTRTGLSARFSRLVGQGAVPSAVVTSLRLYVVDKKSLPALYQLLCVALDSLPPQYVTLLLPVPTRGQLEINLGDTVALLPPW